MIALRVLRHGAVVRELLVEALPAEIGRGAFSHVVLADASVSRVHARLERDAEGRLVLRDLGSRNGLRVAGRRVESAVVEGLLRCHVGGAEIEIEPVAADDTRDVAPAAAAPLRRPHRPWAALGALALGAGAWLALEALDPDLWSPWNDSRGVTLLGTLLAALVALALVGLALLVALKAVGREVHLSDTLGALARLSWLLVGLHAISTAAAYALRPAAAQRLAGLLIDALAVAGVVYLVGLRRRGPSLGFRLAWALGLALLLAGGETLTRLSARQEGQASVSYDVLPPLVGWPGRSVALDAHLEHVRAAAAAAGETAREVHARQQ